VSGLEPPELQEQKSFSTWHRRRTSLNRYQP